MHHFPSTYSHLRFLIVTPSSPPLLTTHTLTGQILHAARVHLKVLSDVSVHATLVPLPLQCTQLGGSLCCHHNCCVPHDKRRGHLLQAQRTVQSFRRLPTRSSEYLQSMYRSECFCPFLCMCLNVLNLASVFPCYGK